MFSDSDLTLNDFLGGRLRLFQPRKGYRAGVDPLLLAAAVPARAGQSVLDLGCGAGAAVLALGCRVAGLELAGVELQPPYAELARRNAAQNRIALDLHCADLRALPAALRRRGFDHVIANPPYFPPGAHSAAADPGRRTALGEAETPLADWVACAARRLAPGGYLHLIQRSERLPDLILALQGRLGAVELLPLAARPGRAPGLVILRARKGRRSPFRLHAPLILHQGAEHQRDGEDYAPAIAAVLRDGAALPWPGQMRAGSAGHGRDHGIATK